MDNHRQFRGVPLRHPLRRVSRPQRQRSYKASRRLCPVALSHRLPCNERRPLQCKVSRLPSPDGPSLHRLRKASHSPDRHQRNKAPLLRRPRRTHRLRR
jgi:hypothetical protein